jgi:hypothetical protein
VQNRQMLQPREPKKESNAITSPPQSLEAAPGSNASRLDRSRLPRLAQAALAVLLVSLTSLLVFVTWQPVQPRSAAVEATGVTKPIQRAPPTSDSVSEEGLLSPADDQTTLRRQQADHTTQDDRNYDSASGDVAVAPPEPMVYIHVRNAAQRARAEQMIEPLTKRGVRVTGIKTVSSGPATPDLRYFRSEEADEAAWVMQALRDIGLPAALKRVSGYESTATLRQYELWLGQDVKRVSKAETTAKRKAGKQAARKK